MRVKLEPETAFVGKKFSYIFFGVIFGLNAITFILFFIKSSQIRLFKHASKFNTIKVLIFFILKNNFKIDKDIS